ncbi:acyl-CoA dehydrogenase [Actinomycetospora termitidis]|uniref:Acyl-CoA dehydrogenase n=1 Tax=Actinomycetospora termitidis TaxID=3053470 RepID=A0ABT7M606_9PSEU|nr:acyl-CoA dehydrogenase [Actinomycetospora sp. Odt1-22]MDL5156097.1 acyl-CoA dehydrogenase [Actinomycetospora sp. Odt1-22]
MSDTAPDPDLLALVEDFFGTESGTATIAAAETGEFPTALWRAADGIGLSRIGLPEERGGAGGGIGDAVAVLIGSGRHAVPLPLLETWTAGWALTSAGRPVDGEPTGFAATAALRIDDGRASGDLHAVPWGRNVSRLVALHQDRVLLLDVRGATVRERTDLAGMPADDLTVDGTPAETLEIAREDLLSRAMLGRAAQLAGAIDAAAALTREYTQQREQFGRPIGRFQAVAEHVVLLAEAAAMSLHVVERAAMSLAFREAAFEATAAKLVVAEQAGIAIAAAHQAHGAMGMTREYRLQHLTRRLMTWRADLGDAANLATRLSHTAVAASSLAHLITDPEPRLEPAP